MNPPESRQNSHRTGEANPWRHKQNLVLRTQEKGAVAPQETDPDLPGVSRSLQQRRGSVVACGRVGGAEHGRACVGPFEGGRHSLHYLYHCWVKQQGENTATPINRKLD